MQSNEPLPRFKQVLTPVLNLELWVVALAVAGSMANTSLLPVAVILALFFWPLRWLATGRISRRTPLDWPVLLLSVMLMVSIWATAIPDTTSIQVWRVFTGIALFYAVVNWADSSGRLTILLFGMAAVGVVLAVIAPFSVVWSVGKLPFIPTAIYDRFVVLFVDFIHPNVLGGSLALLLPVLIAWLLFGYSRLSWLVRIGIGLAILAAGGVLILTAARGAWLGLAGALLILILLRWRWGWIGLLAAGLVVIGLAFNPGLPALLEFLSSNNAISGLDGRVEIWSRAIFMIQDFPFTGIGMGSFGKVADALYPFFLNSASIPHAHNLFLQVAVDLGLPGLIAWLSIAIIAAGVSWNLLMHGRRRREPLWQAIGAGMLASTLVLVVHGMIDSVVWGMVKPAPLVWLLWGLAVAGWQIAAEEKTF
jgi:putative inorganic carbon (HCO3(-)) transporter